MVSPNVALLCEIQEMAALSSIVPQRAITTLRYATNSGKGETGNLGHNPHWSSPKSGLVSAGIQYGHLAVVFAWEKLIKWNVEI